MKGKNIMMTILLAVGFIAAKAANGFPPELVLVSQPVLTYNDYSNTITVYYDVQNIGDYRYKGYVYIYLDPDNGHYYAREWVRVSPGKIKRIAIDIPAYRPNPAYAYTIMPYYELGNDLYSFTTFEYFEPLVFHWNGRRTEPWVVYQVGPRVRYYVRPGDYRYYYDGFRPMLPPPVVGYGPSPIPPMDPHHHTYHYHNHNGGYPGAHYYYDDHGHATPINHNSQATVRPHDNGTSGSMSTNGAGVGTSNGSGNNSATVRPNGNSAGHNSGAVRPNGNGNSNNGASIRPNSGNTSNSGASRPSSGNSSVGRTERPSNSGNNVRPSSGVSSGSNSGTSRPSSGTSSVGRTERPGNSGNNVRPSSGSSNNSSSGSARVGNSSSSTNRSSSPSSTNSSGSRSNSSGSRSGSSSNGARR